LGSLTFYSAMVICTLHPQYSEVDQSEENKVGGSCSTRGTEKLKQSFGWKNLTLRVYLEDLDTDGIIILE
jgi:hypothetical protein